MTLTIADLKSYVRSQSRRDFNDYGAIEPWRNDSNNIKQQRRRVYKSFPTRWRNATEQLVPGNYGRLTITETDIEYTAGQYAPVEIWHYVYAYLHETN